MRMRNPKDKDEILSNCDYFYNDKSFENSNPIHIEIGMGKGNFILNMALKYPNINFIGIEKYSSVASVAIKKINEYKPSNLRILIIDAIDLKEILSHQVSCIYLNFSDPWPKDRHAKRRLTSPIYLDSYDELFVDKKVIVQKTDNDNLFDYSLETLKSKGYTITNYTRDLHSTDIDNVPTEYEMKFAKKGIKIKYLKAEM